MSSKNYFKLKQFNTRFVQHKITLVRFLLINKLTEDKWASEKFNSSWNWHWLGGWVAITDFVSQRWNLIDTFSFQLFAIASSTSTICLKRNHSLLWRMVIVWRIRKCRSRIKILNGMTEFNGTLHEKQMHNPQPSRWTTWDKVYRLDCFTPKYNGSNHYFRSNHELRANYLLKLYLKYSKDHHHGYVQCTTLETIQSENHFNRHNSLVNYSKSNQYKKGNQKIFCIFIKIKKNFFGKKSTAKMVYRSTREYFSIKIHRSSIHGIGL